MAVKASVCCIFLICCLGAHGLTELFCKDPDTGEFHAVNKTWSSTTVCGNYTCRIRRKVKDDMDTHASEIQVVTALPSDDKLNKIEEAVENAENKNEDRTNEEHSRSILEILTSHSANSDRYLTDSEIRSISELLHMVKKSDLEAVVEVYNLAQDIYKELESATVENKEEVYKHVLSKLKSDKPSKLHKNEPNTYWYDPQQQVEEKSDPLPAASDPVLSNQAYPYYNSPYYYPVSTFHRHASYVHPTRQMPVASPVEYYRPQPIPCPYTRREDTTLLPYPFAAVNLYNQTSPYRAYWTQNPYKYAPMQSYVEEPKKAVLINPELYNDVQDIEQHLEKRGGAMLHKVERKEDKDGDTSQRSLFNPEDILPLWLQPLGKSEEKLAPWQTAPLSDHVLEEVKANILQNTEKLLNPFRKLKLEKVAKVLKLDDLTRPKRELVEIVEPVTIDHIDFEVYIEKLTCDMETEPGVFSVGNLTAPYPECCPKRIINK